MSKESLRALACLVYLSSFVCPAMIWRAFWPRDLIEFVVVTFSSTCVLFGVLFAGLAALVLLDSAMEARK